MNEYVIEAETLDNKLTAFTVICSEGTIEELLDLIGRTNVIECEQN